MPATPDPAGNRRAFLSGQALRQRIEAAGNDVAEALTESEIPTRGPTVMLRIQAMATDFDVLMNPDGPADQVAAASDALDEVTVLEQMLSVYRPESDLSRLNQQAAFTPVVVDEELFSLLLHGKEIAEKTGHAFDPVSGSLIQLWRLCRREGRLPSEHELTAARRQSGLSHVTFDPATREITFDTAGVGFDLGAIGKGYAVDRAGSWLLQQGVENWLVHGGKSSVLARGSHAGHVGWPIGLRNPLFPDRPYLTLLLKDAAISTSGTAVQWFRVGDQRYGHILDPRTGWPVDTMLSVSVIAPDAALADALSTAFFVLGVEKALSACDNFLNTGVILFPYPADGRTLEPVFHNIDMDRVFRSMS